MTLLPSEPVPTPTPASPVRVGILGCVQGRVRYGSALPAVPALQVVALADTDTRMMRSWKREIGGAITILDDPEALWNPELALDAVLISAPVPARAAYIQAAAMAGLAILCDMPFSPTLAESDAPLRAAKTQGVLLMPVLPRRFDPVFQTMAQRIAEEARETGKQMRCDWSFPAYDHAQGDYEGAIGHGGGSALLQTIANQTVDIGRWWLGEALAVSADLDDVATAGALVRASQVPGRRQTSPSHIIVTHERGYATHRLIRTPSVHTDERYVFHSSQGQVELLANAGTTTHAFPLPALTLHRPGQRTELLPTLPSPADLSSSAFSRMARLLAHFADCVQNGNPPQVCGTDVRAAQEIVQAAYISTREGVKVTLPLHSASI